MLGWLGLPGVPVPSAGIKCSFRGSCSTRADSCNQEEDKLYCFKACTGWRSKGDPCNTGQLIQGAAQELPDEHGRALRVRCL